MSPIASRVYAFAKIWPLIWAKIWPFCPFLRKKSDSKTKDENFILDQIRSLLSDAFRFCDQRNKKDENFFLLKRASWVRNIIVFIKFSENWIQKSKIWINQGDWVLKDQFMMLSPYERTWSKKILFVRNQKSRTFIEIWMPWKSPFPFLSKVPNLRFLKNHKTEKSIFFYFGPILAQDSMDMKLGGFWADLAIFVDDFAYSLKICWTSQEIWIRSRRIKNCIFD